MIDNPNPPSAAALKKIEDRVKSATHYWVGFCKCGMARMWSIEIKGDEKDIARFVSDGIKGGYRMERMEKGAARETLKGAESHCLCHRQTELFE